MLRAMTSPERWNVDAGDRALAKLDIPPHASRERRFEIDVRFVVRAGAGATPMHALKVLIDGAQQWSRQVTTVREGDDSLEWRQRRTVPAGQPLRIQAVTEVQHTLRRRLVISAHEE